MLLFHPDFLYGHMLGTTIKSYGYFSYEFNEALHLSGKEEQTVAEIFTKIDTQKKAGNALLVQFEKIVNQYFDSQAAIDRGLPSMDDIASQLNISPRYMSDMLRTLTGQSAQQRIQEVIIEKAKEKLSTTTLSVAEITYELGLERPQSFNNYLKIKPTGPRLNFGRVLIKHISVSLS